MASLFSHLPLSLIFLGASACAGRTHHPTTPATVHEMEALRIVAKHDAGGQYSFESYDAEELFSRANEQLNAGRCREAVPLYDRITSEFAPGRYASAAYYNAALCLAQLGEKEAALARFEGLLVRLPESSDAKHASFQAGHLRADLQQWGPALQLADSLLSRADLEAAERMEAMALRSQALLGKKALEDAEHQARQALLYAQAHAEDLASDPYYAAEVTFVIAETLRMRAEMLAFPDTNQEEQREVLLKRAQLLLDAQREYFNAVRYTTPRWAAASGQRIGAMYEKLYRDIMDAPIPGAVPDAVKAVYPQELAKAIQPLLRHAIRYWELALKMVEGLEMDTEWADATRNDLERTRRLLLDPAVRSPVASEASPN